MLQACLNKGTVIDTQDPYLRARVRRIGLLLILVVILSIGDLASTIINVKSIGMHEVNPLAAFIITRGSMVHLALFKLGSVFASASLILMVRHSWKGELAAWTAAAILSCLTFYWYCYNTHMLNLNDSIVLTETQQLANWVRVTDDPIQ
ncbi:MAG: hypothetical protein D8M59_00660 [Planctomycetes bacterium]|nr:hypothetical protein [Planctomycetota bacterium]NOG54767.1 hypothetical protein [Planctomycetota bacterium]